MKAEIQQKYNELWEREYAGNDIWEDLKDLLDNGQNVSIIIVGPTQTGKSTISQVIGEALDPFFQEEPNKVIRERFKYGVGEFIKKTNEELPSPGLVVGDDFGTELSGLKGKLWYDPSSIALTDKLQVQGYQGRLIIYTLPSLSFLNKDARILCTHYIETNRRWFKKKAGLNKVLVQKLEYGQKKSKIYFPNYKKDGAKILEWYFEKPITPGLMDAYLNYSNGRKGIVEDLAKQKIDYQQLQHEKAFMTPHFLVDKIMANLEKYVYYTKNKKPMIKKGLLSANYGASDRTIDKAREIVKERLMKHESMAAAE